MKRKRLQGVGAPGAADTNVDCHRRSEGAESCAHAQVDRHSISAALEIARLVAAPARPVVLIDAENRSPRRCGLDELPEAMRDPRVATFAVVPRADLVAIDADSSAQVESAIDFAAWCRGELFDVVVCNSGGATDEGIPRVHVWVRVEKAHDRNRVRGKARSLGLPIRDMSSAGTSGAIRPPGAPHRSSDGFSQPIDVTLSDFGLLLSGRPYRRREPRAIPTPYPPPEIAPQAKPERVEGTFEAGRRRDATRSADVFGEFVRARRRGLHLDQALDELDGRASAKAKEAGPRWCAHQWQSAGDLLDRESGTGSQADALAALAFVRHQARHYRFPGRTGPAAKRVLDVLLDHAEAQGGMRASLSIRTLCERTKLGLWTVVRALRVLRGRDRKTDVPIPEARVWLTVEAGHRPDAILWADGTRRHAPRAYAIAPPARESVGITAEIGSSLILLTGTTPHPREETRTVRSMRLTIPKTHPAYAWKGLGPSGFWVLEALRSGHSRLSEIAREAGVSRATVCRKLRTLEFYGVVESTGGSWSLVQREVAPGLDGIAQHRRLDQRDERVRVIFEAQRAEYYRRGGRSSSARSFSSPDRVLVVRSPRPPPGRAAA